MAEPLATGTQRMSEPLVIREDEEGISTLTLNRPEALNALSPALFVELRGHLDDLAATPDEIGCIILCGKGRSFSAGNDLRAIQAGESAPTPYFQAETLERIEVLPQVVIASVHGHCYTGSLELVLACDLLIAAESARFADTHGKWAMVPTWGMTQRLPRRVGPVRAKEMMFTGRTVSGRESAAMNLANECVADDELKARTRALALEIVANSWHTLRSEKRLISEELNMDYRAALAHERENGPGVGADMAERLRAFGKT